MKILERTFKMVKNQHYIPQFYLKRFGKDEKIDAYDIKNKKFITNTNVSNFASKRFFYDIELEKLDEHISLLKKIYNIDDTDEDLSIPLNTSKKHYQISRERCLFF